MSTKDDIAKCLNQTATQTGFARLVGVSQQAISERLHQGTLLADGTYIDWLLSYCEKLRTEASGRSGDAQENLTAARTRRERIDGDLKEMQFHREIKTLVPVEEIEPMLESWASVASAEIQNAVIKIVEAIESKYKIKVEAGIIDGPLETAYELIADYPRDLAICDEPGGGKVEAA